MLGRLGGEQAQGRDPRERKEVAGPGDSHTCESAHRTLSTKAGTCYSDVSRSYGIFIIITWIILQV